MEPTTITLKLSKKLELTLAAINRATMINLYAQESAATPPSLPQGYTHEDALKIDEYKSAFEAYEARTSSDGSMRVLGASRMAALDFIGGEELDKQQKAFKTFCKRYALTTPDEDDPLLLGYALYAAAQVAPELSNVNEVFEFLFQALGVPSALIAAERKSAEGDDRGQATG